jgi:GNAT superfamily N-acetyltransferase
MRWPGLEHTGSMSSDLIRAERALHQRMRLAFEAAVAAGLPGRFLSWEQDGLLAASAGDPLLGHLSTVTGVTLDNVAAAVDLARSSRWEGCAPTVLVPADLGDDVATTLRDGGLTQVNDRMLALRGPGECTTGTGPLVMEPDDTQPFVDLLLAGYQVDGPVATFIAAEHSSRAVRRYLAVVAAEPIAAAALTLHGDVAVVGGASTVPGRRGEGSQSALLRHRISVATQAGCDLLVATAQPNSVSAANLRKAGFHIVRRTAWTSGAT